MSDSDEHHRFPSFQPPTAVYVCSQVLASIFPLVYLVIGAVYLRDCPRQPYIPIYLIVMGIISLLVNVLSLLPSCASFPYLSMALNGIIVLFAICWFITGNVWIYSIYPPSYSTTTLPNDTNYSKTLSIDGNYKTSFSNDTDYKSSIDPYCNKTLYLFAFWTNNLFYILIALSIFLSCCYCFQGG